MDRLRAIGVNSMNETTQVRNNLIRLLRAADSLSSYRLVLQITFFGASRVEISIYIFVCVAWSLLLKYWRQNCS